ncbi:MAG: glycosyltransferase family 2 protein [Candidatus Moraniibacteriota bacterium]|nr:MAG: glycosyltransferase family 2 protein [Candidatus Moranbacteria bacterium]
MKLIINIPAFNEEMVIAKTIKGLPRKLQGLSEILIQVIDDGSQDNTAEIAKKAGADIVYSHSTNRGIGKTFKTAIEIALENGADYFVNIDADGQFDAKDIPLLLDPVLKGKADMVVADRFGGKEAKNIPWIKDALNRLAARIVGGFLRTKINDLTCGFRALNRETMLRLNLPGDFTYTQETIIDAIGKNLKVEWVPVHVTYFVDRKSRVVRTIRQFVSNSFSIIIKAIRDVRPLKFFGIPGFIMMLIAVSIFLVFLFFYFQEFKITPYRNWLLFSFALFVVGLQFTVFAFIADMIRSSRRLTEDLLYRIKKEHYKK